METNTRMMAVRVGESMTQVQLAKKGWAEGIRRFDARDRPGAIRLGHETTNSGARPNMVMLPTTFFAIKSIIAADPNINLTERNRILHALRQAPNDEAVPSAAPAVARIIRRSEVASRLACSRRTVDNLARAGVLVRRSFPGRKRAAGFLEADVVALISGRTK